MFSLYPVKLALESLWNEKLINTISVLTIAAGLFIIALGVTTLYNVERIAGGLPKRFTLSVYLKDDIGRTDAGKILKAIQSIEEVSEVDFISREEALEELKETLKGADYVLQGLSENPLPASFELKLRQQFVSTEFVSKLTKRLLQLDGVDEVSYGIGVLQTLQKLMSAIRTIGLGLIIIVSTGIVFVCYSTVKILFYRRDEEVETQKLLGATKCFIRAPFVIEGSIIGFTAGLLALSPALLLRAAVSGELREVLLMSGFLTVPLWLFLILPLAGIFIGATGALLALGRVRL